MSLFVAVATFDGAPVALVMCPEVAAVRARSVEVIHVHNLPSEGIA